ncbi:serine hydrolase [Microvirga sp. M2]|uniref:serine hydrolase n=1 Tax=Microvirga sp. M2 TaxID=3073270 RepID=UPI0039C200C1
MLERFGPCGLTREGFALTLLVHDKPLNGQPEGDPPARFAIRGSQPFYPCSVVKLFYLVAAQQRLDEGLIQPHEELSRAMRDMIRVSSNTATNYVIDLVTETTGDTLLAPEAMADWVYRRHWVNRFFAGFDWPEFEPINLCQKLMDDQRYGREQVFVGQNGVNHNRLTTDATARLFHAVMTGTVVSPARSKTVRDYLARPHNADFVRDEPNGQIFGYFGAGLPPEAKLWSKAGWTGWTGDPTASYRRHDAAYVELAGGRQFTLAAFTYGREISANLEVLPRLAAATCALVEGLPMS